jgi:hypothetical protein
LRQRNFGGQWTRKGRGTCAIHCIISVRAVNLTVNFMVNYSVKSRNYEIMDFS